MSPHLNWSPSSLPPLDGRTYVVTGGNTGIGYWTVHHLALHGATVYMTSRSAEKGRAAIVSLEAAIQAAKPDIDPDPKQLIHLVVMDLMSLPSVVQGARLIRAQCSQLHGIVNSAGIMATPFLLSDDGYESQFQTNYLAHWLLTWHLLPLLESTAPQSPAGAVRVVNVTSTGHAAAPKDGIHFTDTSLRNSFTFRRYGQSKLANILHAAALQARYTPTTSGTGTTSPTESSPSTDAANPLIYALSLHPGNVDTQLNTKSWGASLTPLLRCLGVYITPEQGSFNSLWAVASSGITAGMGGGYFMPVGKTTTPSKQAQDAALVNRLWVWTENEMRDKGLLEPL